MVGSQEILGGGACQPVCQVSFSIVMGCQNIGKDRHHNKEQDDHPTGRPQGLLPPQPEEEIRKPAPSLGLAFRGGYRWGVTHSSGI